MSQLNILAVQNAPLLRALAENPTTSKAELATLVGKDRSNLNRSIAALAEAGLLIGADDGQRDLTDDGHAQLAAIERAEGGQGEPGSSAALPPDHVVVVHSQLVPDPDNARKDWDSAEAVADLVELAESIDQSGLLQNPMVKVASAEFQQPDQPTVYMLDGGERRWRAIARLIADGRWPADRPILCRLIETDELGHRLAALAENLQRRNLNPLEKAKAFEGLAEALAAQGVATDKINRDIADRIGVTIEHVQQHRNFLKLDEADQQRLALPKDDVHRMTVREARQKLAILAKEAEAAEALRQVPVAIRLAAVELVHAVIGSGTYTWGDVPVRADARDTEIGRRLAELGWVRFSATVSSWGKSRGFFTASRDYSMPSALLPTYSNKNEVETVLNGLYAEAGLTRGEGPATDWLTPGDMPPEGAALDETEKAREASRAAAEAERQAAREREAQVAAEARARHLAIINSAAESPPADMTEATLEAAKSVQRPLPWTLLSNGEVIDAGGEEVSEIGTCAYGQPREQDLLLAQVIVVAVNTAAGLPTPPIKSADEHYAEPDDDDDQEADEAEDDDQDEAA